MLSETFIIHIYIIIMRERRERAVRIIFISQERMYMYDTRLDVRFIKANMYMYYYLSNIDITCK